MFKTKAMIKKIYLFQIALFFSVLITRAQAPTISAYAPATGTVGTTVVITGNNFDATPANNIVRFGGIQAAVSASTVTQLTVTVPAGVTPQFLAVTNLTTDLTGYNLVPYICTYPCGGLINAGSFAAKTDLATQNSPWGIAIGDLDGDGKNEVAVVNTFSNSVSVYRNTSTPGAVSYAGPSNYTTASSPVGLTMADVDRDGKMELVSINQTGNISVFRNNCTPGTISFFAKVDYAVGSGPYGIAVHDMDGDGKPELISANTSAGQISVLRNNAVPGTINAGSFGTAVNFFAGSSVQCVTIGDLDGDGKPDIATANQSSTTMSLLRNTCTTGTITAGSFAAKYDIATGSNPSDVAIVDLDADGKPEIALTNGNGATLSIYKNTATSGTITASSFAAPVNFTCSGNEIASGDMDGDGKPDLVLTGNNAVSVFKNTATTGTITTGSFAAKVDFATGTAPYDVALGDIDGDGKLDIATPNNSANTFSTIRNIIGSIANMTSAATATVCASTSVNLALTGNISSSFSWIATDNPNTTGESITTNTATTLNDVITNTTTDAELVTYTITPTSISSTCPGTPQTVTVTVNPAPYMTSASTYTVCSGYAENLVLSASLASTYTWNATNNPNTTGETTATQTTSVINNTVQNNTASAQAVIYHVTPTDTLKGCVGPQQTVTITVQPRIYNVGSASTSICSKSAVNFTFNPNSPATYSWTANDNLNTTGESLTTQTTSVVSDMIISTSTVTQTVIYPYTLISNATGCPSVAASLTVTVYPSPVITITATPSSASVCIGGTMRLAANGSQSNIWTGGITNNVNFTPTVTAVYTVTSTESANGCSDTASKLVTVKQLLVVGPISGATALCSGTSATVYSVSPVVGALSYAWTKPGGWTGTSTTNTISATPGSSGVFSVTASNSCGPSLAQTLSVTVNAPTTDAGPPSYNTCLGGSIQLTGTSTSNDGANAQHYLWSPSAGLNNATISNPIATPTVTTMYHLTATDTVDGCTAIDSVNIIVGPIAVTANNGTITCGSAATLTASVAAGNYIAPLSYTWTPSTALSTTTGTTTSANPIATTTYYVTMTTGNGCSGTTPSTVTVNGANFSVNFSAVSQLITLPTPAQFTNSTPSLANYNFTWDFGDGVIIQNNNGTVFHTYQYNGNFDVTLIAVSKTTGCADTLFQGGYIFCTGGTSCSLTATVTPNGGLTKCVGDTVWLTCNTGSGYTYQWNLNGSAISGATSSTYGATVAGNYAVTINNGACSVISQPKAVSFVSPPATPTITTSGSINVCGGGSVILTATAGYVSYLWSNSATTQNTTVSSSGVYTVTVGNGTAGCTASATYALNAASVAAPSICIVTVDSTSTNNIIYWDKTVYPIAAIDSFIIYREVSTNIYKRVGAVSKDSLSMFVDVDRSVGPANGDPNIGYYHYKLQVRDSCGTYSALSPYHTSVYFNDQLTGTFTWNLYDVEGQTTPVANFELYRDDNNTGNYLQIGTVAGTTTLLNDPNYTTYQFIANWRVEATGFTCVPTMRLGNNSAQGTIVKAKSNITNNRTTGTMGWRNDLFSVYPNPFSNEITLVSSVGNHSGKAVLYNVLGEKIHEFTLKGTVQKLDLSDLKAGVYYIQVQNTQVKIVKQ